MSDTSNSRIQKFQSDGAPLIKWGKDGSFDGAFYFPRGLTVDFAGHIYVADEGNHRIQKFDPVAISWRSGEEKERGSDSYNLPGAWRAMPWVTSTSWTAGTTGSKSSIRTGRICVPGGTAGSQKPR